MSTTLLSEVEKKNRNIYGHTYNVFSLLNNKNDFIENLKA